MKLFYFILGNPNDLVIVSFEVSEGYLDTYTLLITLLDGITFRYDTDSSATLGICTPGHIESMK